MCLWDILALEAAWPVTLTAPHADCRREPEAYSGPEQAEPHNGHSVAAWVPKGCYFQWEAELWTLPLVLLWLRVAGLSSGFPSDGL